MQVDNTLIWKGSLWFSVCLLLTALPAPPAEAWVRLNTGLEMTSEAGLRASNPSASGWPGRGLSLAATPTLTSRLHWRQMELRGEAGLRAGRDWRSGGGAFLDPWATSGVQVSLSRWVSIDVEGEAGRFSNPITPFNSHTYRSVSPTLILNAGRDVTVKIGYTESAIKYPAYQDLFGPERDRNRRPFLSLGKTWGPKAWTLVTLDGEVNGSGVEEGRYRGAGVSAQIWRRLGARLTLHASDTYRRRSYEEDGTAWNRASCALSYALSPGAEVGLSYLRYDYSSQTPRLDTARNRLTLGVHLSFGSQDRKREAAPPAGRKVEASLAPRLSGRGWVFQVRAPCAQSVRLVGTFNAWDAARIPLSGPDGEGVWTVVVTLEPGTYQYSFVVDGEQWIRPPDAPAYVEDGFGRWNGLLVVGTP